MNQTLQAKLQSLPSLTLLRSKLPPVACKICGDPAPYIDTCDFQKAAGGNAFGLSGIEVHWHRCKACDFMFTPFFDEWDKSDFAAFVYNSDYIKVDPGYAEFRPKQTADRMANHLARHARLRILDYGGGNGLMARMLQDYGFNATSYDPFSSTERPRGKFDIITCFEVIEHTAHPLDTMEDITSLMADEAVVIIGETLQPPDIADQKAAWWYCAPRNGHCSTYSATTMARLAERFGIMFHHGKFTHCMRRGAQLLDLANQFGPEASHTVLVAVQ